MRDGVVDSFEAQFITRSGSAQAKIGDLWCAGEPEGATLLLARWGDSGKLSKRV
jgi:hypothetical protein